MIAARSSGRQKIITLPGIATMSNSRSSDIVARSAVHPPDRRLRPPGELQQVVIEIDSDHVDATPVQLDRHPSHATAGVEHRPGWNDSMKSASP